MVSTYHKYHVNSKKIKVLQSIQMRKLSKQSKIKFV